MSNSTVTLADRVSRFAELDVIDAQRGIPLPQHVADLIYSRKLMPVVTRDDNVPNPLGNQAPIRGAGDIAITYAVCPPGTGPTFHSHRKTYETFTVMQGRFEFQAYDAVGETPTTFVLDRFDTLSVPPGVYRGFRCVSDEEGMLQVIITGGAHDASDIYFPAATARRIAAEDPAHLEYFKAKGLFFEAG